MKDKIIALFYLVLIPSNDYLAKIFYFIETIMENYLTKKINNLVLDLKR